MKRDSWYTPPENCQVQNWYRGWHSSPQNCQVQGSGHMGLSSPKTCQVVFQPSKSANLRGSMRVGLSARKPRKAGWHDRNYGALGFSEKMGS